MTRIELLRKYLEKERQRLFETSADYKLKNPKKGFEQDHEEATIAISLLEELIAEEEAKAPHHK